MNAKKKVLDQADIYEGWADEARPSRSKPPRPTVARGDESPVHSPAHQLQSRVLAQYGEPEVEKWPGLGRIAVIGVGAIAAWTVVGLAVVLATR